MANKIACDRCGDELDHWAETRRFGFWDADAQHYISGRCREERYCRDCWDDREGRANGAHYYPESAAELYDVLAAADGKLAATLTWWSGKPSIRVVDGEVEASVTKRRDGGQTDDGTQILKFESELIDDFDRDEFDEVADPPDSAPRNLVILEDPERTSFAGVDQDQEAGDE